MASQLNERLKILRAHPRMRHGDNFQPVRFGELRDGLTVTRKHRFERVLLLPLGVLRRELAQATEREHGLCVQRVFRPEGAILIERGDAILGFDILGTGFFRRILDERNDRFSRRSVIPRGQRISLGMRTSCCEQHND